MPRALENRLISRVSPYPQLGSLLSRLSLQPSYPRTLEELHALPDDAPGPIAIAHSLKHGHLPLADQVDAVINDDKKHRRAVRERNKKARALASRPIPKKSINAPTLPPIPIATGPSLISRIGGQALPPLPPRPHAPKLTYHAPGPLALPSHLRFNKEDGKARFQSQISATLKRLNVIFAPKELFDALPQNTRRDLHVIADQVEWLYNNFEEAYKFPDVVKFRISYGLKYIGGVKTYQARQRYLIIVNELVELLTLGYFSHVPCKEEL